MSLSAHDGRFGLGATAAKSKRPISTGWPRTACGSRNSTIRPVAGRRRRGPVDRLLRPAGAPRHGSRRGAAVDGASGRIGRRCCRGCLSPLGYRCYHSGKWHVDGMPLAGGFDHSLLPAGTRDAIFNPKAHSPRTTRSSRRSSREPGYYATIAIADHAVRVLQEHAAKYAGRPFFHYLAFTVPDFPLHALPEDIARYREKYRVGWDVILRRRWSAIRKLGPGRGRPVGGRAADRPSLRLPRRAETLGSGEVNRPAAMERI